MSKSSWKSLLFAVALVVTYVGGARALAADPVEKVSGPALRVTYLVYSGRPNPVVLVTDPAQVRAIEARLNKVLLMPARSDGKAQDVLGYNGILIERVGTTVARPEQFVVKGETLRSEPVGGEDARAAASSASVRSSPAAVDLEASLISLGQTRGVLDVAALDMVRDSRN